MNDLAALHAVAQGRVQGVNYRAFVTRNAAALGLTGYVRNMPDNSVEITAEGDKNQLQKLIDLLKKGPPVARVDNLEISWSQYTGHYRDFSVTV
jgi:acylphosphatase